ncbi:MAG TPA: fatty acid desaturase [Rhodocyclaceae bacterium]|nr:fatty acid desaturase [Rhodocyclaceae bacterium]
MPIIASLKELKSTIIDRHVRPDNLKGASQVLSTLLPLAALWYAVTWSAQVSWWLTAFIVIAMSLFLLRVFVLMHECGHRSMFRTIGLNKAFGFIFGVISGMPQQVWAQRHLQHHSTNGNWAQYRGPLNVIPADEYGAMTPRQQRKYRNARSIWLAPVAGFLYIVFNPRINWLKGSVSLMTHLIKSKIAQPGVSLKTHALGFKTPYWASAAEYRAMFWNNVVLIGLWAAMVLTTGSAFLLVCHVISMSLAGGAGILLFTVQHNFEHSYASHDEGWCYNRAALEGTSFLVLPGWLNWLTAHIAYHHIHHLSARIPNYCLVACHEEYKHLFAGVTRIRLSQIPRSLKCILWDTTARRIVSVAEYEQQVARVVSVMPAVATRPAQG